MESDIPPSPPTEVLPSKAALSHARSNLISTLPSTGLGLGPLRDHLTTDLVPGLNRASQSPRFYGFVTGGATPAASFADNIVTACDQNVQVHLPDDTVATDVEDAALRMTCELLDLAPVDWPHRTFMTGATASNVVGLACGREFVIREAAAAAGMREVSVGDFGLMGAMREAGVDEIQILTTVPHSSLRKAASIVGLGRACVKDVSRDDAPHRFDFDKLQNALREPKTGTIVAVSCAEVNTGHFATHDDDMQRIRALCSAHSAWLHVDAAFGLLARLLPASDPQYTTLRSGVTGLEHADSIAGDAHKLLNVPYDTGIFLSRHLALAPAVFQNAGAAYLSAPTPTQAPTPTSIPSPLNIGLENSRRFRALPVYANLAAYGRTGYTSMLRRQIALARGIAAWVSAHPAYELPAGACGVADTYIVVLFRAVDSDVNDGLVERINAGRRIFVSGTSWEGRPAARFAVANWGVVVERDLAVVGEVLEGALLR